MALLQSKLNPPGLRQNTVERSRLLAQLSFGLQHEHYLTLISAPAGYGKSTLAAAWINSLDQEIILPAWVSLDEQENDPIRFWTYFFSAIEQTNPGSLSQILLGLQSSNQLDLIPLLSDALNELSLLSKNVLLVLDDLHQIHNQEIFSQLSFFIDYLPNYLHLMLLTRVDPPLPLPRLRAQGRLTEIRASDLIFSAEECDTLFRKTMGLSLDETVSEDLYRITEGWAAGLQMAGLSYQKNAIHPPIEKFKNKKMILDFLFSEVFIQQSPQTQSVLLSTAIVDQFCLDLAAALSRSLSPQITREIVAESIRQIEEANLFLIPLDESKEWFRYHHLFADLLKFTLKQKSTEDQKKLLLAAANWYWEQWKSSDITTESRLYDWLRSAIQYAAAAEDWQLLSGWLKQVWQQTCHESHITLVEQWLNLIPQEFIDHDINLLGAFAWVMWLQGRSKEAGQYVKLAFARMGLESVVDELDKVPAEHNHLLTLLSFFTIQSGNYPEALKIAAHAYQHSSPTDPLGLGVSGYFLGNLYRISRQYSQSEQTFQAAYPALMSGHNYVGAAAAVYHAAQILMHQGKLSQAEQFCREAIKIAESQKVGHLADYGAVWTALAAIQLARGEFSEAEASLNQAKQRLRYSQLNEMKRGLLRYQYQLTRVKGEKQEAAVLLKKIMETTRQIESSYVQIEVNADQALFWLDQGLPDQAYAWVENGILANLMREPHQNDFLGANAAAALRIFIHQKNITVAFGLCDRLIPAFQAQEQVYDLVNLYLWRAAAFLIRGDKNKAAADVKEALRLSATEKIKSLFLEADESVQKLFFQCQTDTTSEKLFLEDIMRSISAPSDGKHGATELVEALTEREFEILSLIEQGYTNQEIAEKLFITIYTVKKHSGNIFGKLGVNNRTQAIAKARSLNLI